MEVSIHEFKSHLSQYVGKAQAGQLIELTSHRKVVARLVGVPSAGSAGISRLLTSGLASWQGGKPQGAALILKSGGKSMSELVLEGRG
jgi:prevent-host-death family protein